MSERKERKSNLLTVRLTAEEVNALDMLSDHLDKNKSDVMLRACKFFMNTGDATKHITDESGEKKKERKPHRVHLRMSDTDMESLKSQSTDTGYTISQLIRRAIRSLADGNGIRY